MLSIAGYMIYCRTRGITLKIEKIFSKNATFQKFEVLKTNRNKRYKYKEFLVEGVRNINEAIRNGWTISSFLYSFENQCSRWAMDILNTIPTKVNYGLSNALLNDLSVKDDTSEVMAIVKMKGDNEDYFTFADNPLIALFDRPSNKGNLGTLLRSCDALGIERLIITGHAVDIYDPDVLASSMDSFFKVPFSRLYDNAEIDDYIEKLKSKYPLLKIVGTTAHEKTNIYEIQLTQPILFMIGNETTGLNNHLVEICDRLAAIPMSPDSSASSFNVSCAATAIFYEAIRQRNVSNNL